MATPRTLAPLVPVLALAGCASAADAARLAPVVTVGLSVRRTVDSGDGRRRGAEWAGRLGLAWRGRGRVRTRTGRNARPPATVRAPRSRTPCPSAALCRWERRARAHVLGRLLP